MQDSENLIEVQDPVAAVVGQKYQSDIFFAVTYEGQFVEASDGYCQLIGYDKAELFGMNMSDVQIEGAREKSLNGLQHLVDKSFTQISIEQLSKDQRVISFLINAFIGSQDEKIFCFAIENKSTPKAKDGLKLSLELANSLIKNSSDLILITEAEPYHWPGSKIVFANDALLKQTGYTLEEVIGKTPRIFHGPNTDAETAHRIHLALDRWQPIREEVLNYTKDGKEFWQELNIYPLANEVGWFTHWVSIQRNITERKLLEKKLNEMQYFLEESQRRLVIATSAGGVGIWDWDIVNDILIWDDQMYQLYGIQKEQFAGAYESWQNGLHPDDRQEGEKAIQEGIQSGEFKLEFRIVWPDGNIRYIRGHARTLKDSGGIAYRMIGTNWDITEQKSAENKAEELAFFDPLTNLANRRLFIDRLQRAIKATQRSKAYCALFSIDLDNFKMTNDIHGHNGGDTVLKLAATSFLGAVRAGDTVARMGGDEFMILIEDLSSSASEAAHAIKIIAEKIASSFNEARKKTSHVSMGTISIGTTLFQGEGCGEIDELIKQSDLALYQAKEAGRNCIKFYDEDMQASINARMALQATLQQALKNQWFVLHYQPQIDGKGRINSAEALIRLNHPELGLMSPARFIGLAESSDLIVPISWWVIKAVCSQLVSWSTQEKMAHLSISVNISIKQFEQDNFVSKLIKMVDESGANPRLINLELTESLFLGDRANAILKMQALKKHGFNFSLDDFGTGYSSLSYLKSLPFDELKIDQAFVADIPENKTNCDIIRIIIQMGQTLDLKVVAEGVENKVQFQYLHAMGCHHYQGYLFSKPLPVDDFVAATMQFN
jgi:diguanylate cyclase (GGDEF)-like protein/PAS domain S-box-containing protein